MSWEAVDRVWMYSNHRRGAFLVLLAIADYVNEKKGGFAWAGVARLAKKARMSERQVQRHIRELKKSGELQVMSNQGPKGTNLYKPTCEKGPTDMPGTGDEPSRQAVTDPVGGAPSSVTQSVNEPLRESTPIVPDGDEEDFWIKICFDCFEQKPHFLHPYILKRLRKAVRGLDRKHSDSLLRFYRIEPTGSKDRPYSSRRQTPERLLLDLPRQIALALRRFPLPSPKKAEPPRWREFFYWKYDREVVLPKTFWLLGRDLQQEYQNGFDEFVRAVKGRPDDEK